MTGRKREGHESLHLLFRRTVIQVTVLGWDQHDFGNDFLQMELFFAKVGSIYGLARDTTSCRQRISWESIRGETHEFRGGF